VQANEEEVAAVGDHIEVGRREAQEKELLGALSSCIRGTVGAPWFNATFDEMGAFVVFPSWRGIAIGNVATGKVRRRPSVFPDSCLPGVM
jgi:hypothetical protein